MRVIRFNIEETGIPLFVMENGSYFDDYEFIDFLRAPHNFRVSIREIYYKHHDYDIDAMITDSLQPDQWYKVFEKVWKMCE